MSHLTAAHFGEFFSGLHGHSPFPWQQNLAERVCERDWPEAIDLPTASGKTACLDIALFSLAVNSQAPRRIFFVVDRRVIVNEAFERMKRIAATLAQAKDGVLAAVADALKHLAGSPLAPPLDVYELRGGIYRDQGWVRSPLQPTVVTSTVDQVGSRLLFRGYGVSGSSAPIHAALIANDSLIFLDEAHCSRAFSQTLSAIRTYRGNDWAHTPLKKAFSFVEMTATPSQPKASPFHLTEADRENAFLRARLYAEKPATLHLVKARANDVETLAEALAAQALSLAAPGAGVSRVVVMVNRIATARRVFDILRTKVSPPQNLHLLIGRMRPVDRDKLVERLKPLKAGAPRDPQTQATFVVSTQCLEVGADLDFDVLVTECASIDAVLQRFGRLDRLGACEGKARGAILAASGVVDSKDPDPIYGYCLAHTWRWLNTLAGDSKQLNLGIDSFDPTRPTVANALKALPPADAEMLRRLGQNAPALLPAHLDVLVQTSPRPHADLDVALFLHGRDSGPPEIQVVWRADLNTVQPQLWNQIVALCPPVSAEAMPVRLDQFRRWLTGALVSPVADSDLEGIGEITASEDEQSLQSAVIWRGDESQVVRNASDIRPNDTIILSLAQAGWEHFGHIPEPHEDMAEQAIFQAHAQTILRIHEQLWPEPEQLKPLLQQDSFDWGTWNDLFARNRDFLASKNILSADKQNFRPPLSYPANADGSVSGWILQSRQRSARTLLREDEGDDGPSHTDLAATLAGHTEDVRKVVEAFSTRLLPDYSTTLAEAARLHDSGKADMRFQAMLHGGDHLAAAYYPQLLAKSDALSTGLFRTAKARSGLPVNFRHELLSLHFAVAQCRSRDDIDLILHLVACHHGYCRPFAPVVLDYDCPDVSWQNSTISSADRLAQQAHHLSSGVARRFWRFTREFGWWGAAYLEACLRLADWAASEPVPSGRASK